MTRWLLATVLVATAVGLTAAPASAKEDVKATLTTPVPLAAAPGDEIKVAWTLSYEDENGTRRPFGAYGVIIQLESASDGQPTVGFATGHGGGNGSFEAVVVVPEGGIGGIAIGLGGTVSDSTDTRSSYVYFPVVNSPLPAVTDPTSLEGARAPKAPPPAEPTASPGGGSRIWIAALALAFVAALVSVVVLVRHRRHPAAA